MEKHYFTGVPCHNGHLAKRYVTTRTCVQCAKENFQRYYGRKKFDGSWDVERKVYSLTYERTPRVWAGKLVTRLRRKCRNLSLPFDLDVDFLTQALPERCPVLGIKLVFSAKPTDKEYCASIDRLIPELGYTKSNVRVISYRANRLKSDGTLEELTSLASWLRKEIEGT